MFHIRLIIFWYAFLNFLVFFSSITLSSLRFLPAVLLVWVLLLVFFLGSKLKYGKKIISVNVQTDFCANNANILYLLIATAFILFFPFYIQYYTGSSVFIVFLNLFSGVSNYLAYQDHFSTENLNVFSFAKLPYIIGAGLLKFLFIACLCRLMAFRITRNYLEISSVIIMAVVNMILAISRGTSFEFFELIVLFVFAILLRRRRMDLNNWLKRKTVLLVSVIGVLIILIFSYNIDARGDFNCISNEMCFNNQGILARLSPQIGQISFKLSGYFIFGLFVLSTSLTSISIGSIAGFFALFLPFGMSIMGLGSSYSKVVCEDFMDCSVAWIPDLLILLNDFGLIGVFLAILILGAFSKRVFYKTINGSISSSVLLYFIFLFMISLPVGNFITASSANVIALFCSIILYVFPSLERFFFGFFKLSDECETSLN